MAARKPVLTDDHVDDLHDLVRVGVGYPNANTQLLASLGLVVTGRSRFGDYVKPTSDALDKLQNVPVAATGPAKAGNLLRGTGPRKRRAPVSNAR